MENPSGFLLRGWNLSLRFEVPLSEIKAITTFLDL